MATEVGTDSKAPLSIATTPRCRRGYYSIPWFAPIYPWFLLYSAECWARQHQVPFFVFGMARSRIGPRSPRSVANTLTIIPMARMLMINRGNIYAWRTWKFIIRISVNNNNYNDRLPDIGLGVRVFTNGPGDLGSIPGRVIPKTQKMVLDASLLNTQHNKVRIKGKVEQSRERISALPYTLV